MTKTFYAFLFAAILLLITACDELDFIFQSATHDIAGHLDGAWVTCADLGTGRPVPQLMYMNVGPRVVTNVVQDFNSADYNCEHPGSPPQPKSSAAVYPPGTPTAPSSRSVGPRPNAASSGAAFLPRRVLDLPFAPQGQLSGTGACDPAQPDVLRVNHVDAKVVRLGTCPVRQIAAIPTVTRPLQIAITPDGSTALVTSFDNAVNFIDLASNHVSFTLQTDPSVNPDGIAVTPDGTRAYITSFNPTSPVVQVIDLASRTVAATIPANQYPQGAFMSPDGSQVWITYPLGGSVDVIDTQTNTDITGFSVASPYAVAFNSTGTRAYITSQSGATGTVQVVDANTYKLLNSYTVGAGPVDVAVLYGDQFVVVTNNGDRTVSVIDTSTGKVMTVDAGGTEPLGLSIIR